MPTQDNTGQDDFYEPGCIQVHHEVPDPETHGSLITEAVERIRSGREPVALVPAVDKETGRPVVLIGFAIQHPKAKHPDDVAIAPWAVLLK